MPSLRSKLSKITHPHPAHEQDHPRSDSFVSLISTCPGESDQSVKMVRLTHPAANPTHHSEADEAQHDYSLHSRHNPPQQVTSDTNRASMATSDHQKNAVAVINEAVSERQRPVEVDLDGIKKARAIVKAWGKPALILSYFGIYLIFFFVSLQSQTSNTLLPYVYSSFALHSLVNVSGIMSSIIGGVFKLPTSKIIDYWGRPQGFLIMMSSMVLGIVLMAVTKNVETYCAGQIFYWLGNDGVQYVLDVMIADTSSLRNRGLMLSFSTTPYIATVFAGPSLAEAFLDGPGFPWGYGVFAIIFPAISVPLAYLFIRNQTKATEAGLYRQTPRHPDRSFYDTVKYYVVEFDAGGMLILISGFVMFLLPFSLAAYQTDGYASPTIIGLIIAGLLLLIAFPFYEIYISPKSFIPWRLLHNRNLMGSGLVIGALFVSFYCWDAYFSSFLQVVYGLSIEDAGYVGNIYDIGSCFFGVIVGVAISYTGRYKIYALCAVPLHMLGAGLMIHFRQPGQGLGYIIMCQIFIACAGGVLVITNQVAAMSANPHADIAVILAVLSLFSSVGGAIGSAVSGAIWTNTFGPALIKLLPEADVADAATIVSSLTVQLSYELGTPARDAIIEAYGIAQWRMCIASVSITFLTLVGVLLWKDIDLDEDKKLDAADKATVA